MSICTPLKQQLRYYCRYIYTYIYILHTPGVHPLSLLLGKPWFGFRCGDRKEMLCKTCKVQVAPPLHNATELTLFFPVFNKHRETSARLFASSLNLSLLSVWGCGWEKRRRRLSFSTNFSVCLISRTRPDDDAAVCQTPPPVSRITRYVTASSSSSRGMCAT